MSLAPAAQATTASAPPPRRKSCGRCVKAKRRCNLRTPCSRCTEKGLTCEYPSAAPDAWKSDQSQTAETKGLDPAALDPMRTDGFDFSGIEDGGVAGLADGYVLDLQMDMGDTPSFLNGCGAFYPVDDTRTDAFDSAEPQSTVSRDVYTREDYADFYELREELDQGKLGNPNSASAYIIAMVRNFPEDLALKMKTTFLHPRLYENDMPRGILNAFTVSMLYSNKNSANEAAVFKVLDANASEVLRQQSNAGSTPLHELLVMVQALLIYQIIRVFDGDIRQRGHAETAMPALREMTAQLEHHRDDLVSISGSSSEPPPWDSWVLEECTRRTVLVSYFFITKYQLLKDAYMPDPGPFRRAHHWTLSRHLWDASSSFEFNQAWKEKPRWSVCNTFVKEVLVNGKGTDVDDLGRMYLVSYLGMDATRRWYYETGSSFD